MNPFFAFILGSFLLGGSSKTVVVNLPPEKPAPTTGKCHACPELDCPVRKEYGFPACNFCYEMYKKYRPEEKQVYIRPSLHHY